MRSAALLLPVSVLALTFACRANRSEPDEVESERPYTQAEKEWVNALASLRAIDQALETYELRNGGAFPDSLEALLVEDETGWAYLGIASELTDPWGRDYVYEPPRDGEPYRLFTYGEDGVAGGEGLARDYGIDDWRKGVELPGGE